MSLKRKSIGGGSGQAMRRSRRCPICGVPAALPWQPFCSARCADIDLGHWLAGDYRVPAHEEDAEAVDCEENGGIDEVHRMHEGSVPSRERD